MEQSDWMAKCLKSKTLVSTPDTLALKTLALYDAHQSLKMRQRHISLIILLVTIPIIAGILYFLTWVLKFDPFYLLRRAFQTNFQTLNTSLTITILSAIAIAFIVFSILKMMKLYQNK